MTTVAKEHYSSFPSIATEAEVSIKKFLLLDKVAQEFLQFSTLISLFALCKWTRENLKIIIRNLKGNSLVRINFELWEIANSYEFYCTNLNMEGYMKTCQNYSSISGFAGTHPNSLIRNIRDNTGWRIVSRITDSTHFISISKKIINEFNNGCKFAHLIVDFVVKSRLFPRCEIDLFWTFLVLNYTMSYWNMCQECQFIDEFDKCKKCSRATISLQQLHDLHHNKTI